MGCFATLLVGIVELQDVSQKRRVIVFIHLQVNNVDETSAFSFVHMLHLLVAPRVLHQPVEASVQPAEVRALPFEMEDKIIEEGQGEGGGEGASFC
jgi:hypothetical protein